MNRDEIWQQLKDEKETVYGRKMLDVFLAVVTELNIKHLEEALDFGYQINDDIIINMINRGFRLEDRPGVEAGNSDLLNKIISKKKDMGGKLAVTILRLYNPEEMKKVADKMNLNGMSLDNIHTLFWLKIDKFQDIKENSIEIISELFGEKLKQFSVEQIFALIQQILNATYDLPGVDKTNVDKLVNVLGGWKSLVEKMMHEQNSLAKKKAWAYHYKGLQEHLNDTGLNEYFAKKIIEYGKDMPRAFTDNLTFIDAESLAKFFYPNIGEA